MKKLIVALILTFTAAAEARPVVIVRSAPRVVVTRTVVVHHTAPAIHPVVTGMIVGAAVHAALAPRPMIVHPAPVVVPVDVCDTLTYDQRVAINAKAVRSAYGVPICHQ